MERSNRDWVDSYLATELYIYPSRRRHLSRTQRKATEVDVRTWVHDVTLPLRIRVIKLV